MIREQKNGGKEEEEGKQGSRNFSKYDLKDIEKGKSALFLCAILRNEMCMSAENCGG
ncbi:Protein CBG25996 [Caenorhabditis briggsae]|uniref:Protein CBG25996 n=1 Tax=Caenorhabditis briggsae TaxID=6238 RepID=B6IKU6_CAEBR|nr:Protein CBG25996 [Caenorhabditis briggsae]CAS00526.1 Protein CBG25996 [Caenorhabditis briggsae]